MPLNRDQIKEIDDLGVIETGEVPGWGDSVYIKPLTAKTRDQMDAWVRNANGDMSGYRVLWIILCVCGEDGEPIFQDEDREWLLDKNADAIDYLFKETQKLSKIGDEAAEEEKGNS